VGVKAVQEVCRTPGKPQPAHVFPAAQHVGQQSDALLRVAHLLVPDELLWARGSLAVGPDVVIYPPLYALQSRRKNSSKG